MISYIVDILGPAPAGLDFLQYIFAGLLMFLAVYIVYKIFSVFLSKIF